MAEFQKFTEALDWMGIVFQAMSSIMKAQTNEEYFEYVERFSDLLVAYWDDDTNFKKMMEENKIRPDLSNPHFNTMTTEKKKDYARMLFRELTKVIHSSGFLPEKKVEGILDEETIDAIIEGTTKG